MIGIENIVKIPDIQSLQYDIPLVIKSSGSYTIGTSKDVILELPKSVSTIDSPKVFRAIQGEVLTQPNQRTIDRQVVKIPKLSKPIVYAEPEFLPQVSSSIETLADREVSRTYLVNKASSSDVNRAINSNTDYANVENAGGKINERKIFKIARELSAQRIGYKKAVVTLKPRDEETVLDNYILKKIKESAEKTRINQYEALRMEKGVQKRSIDPPERVSKLRRTIEEDSIEEVVAQKTIGQYIADKIIPEKSNIKQKLREKPKIEIVREIVDDGITSTSDLVTIGVVKTIRDEAIKTVEFVDGKPISKLPGESSQQSRSTSSNKKREMYMEKLEKFAESQRKSGTKVEAEPKPTFTFKAKKNPETSKIEINEGEGNRQTPKWGFTPPTNDRQLESEVAGMLMTTASAAFALAGYKWKKFRNAGSQVVGMIVDSLKRGFSVTKAVKEAEEQAQRELEQLGRVEGVQNFYRGSKVVGATVGGRHKYNTRSGRGTAIVERKRGYWENQPNQYGFNATDPDREAKLVSKKRK